MFLFFFLYNYDGKVAGDLALFLVRPRLIGMLQLIEIHTGYQVPCQAFQIQNEGLSLVISQGPSGGMRAMDTLWGKLDYTTEELTKL